MKNNMRGSQKHLIDFIESNNFIQKLNQIFSSFGLIIDSDSDEWMPKGASNPREAELVYFIKNIDINLSKEIRSWWLSSSKKANTPNWDFVSTCKINNVKGLLLFEAKAHNNELSVHGKTLKKNSSIDSKANHLKITNAINEANNHIKKEYGGINISIEKCYQLSNRIAYSWWLANHGIPVILVYVGFLNADDVADVGEPFKNPEDWNLTFREYSKKLGVDKLIDNKIDCGNSYFILTTLALDTKG